MIDRVIGIFTLIVVMGIIAVVLSKRANTANVIKASLNGFSSSIKAAQSPVTSSKSSS